MDRNDRTAVRVLREKARSLSPAIHAQTTSAIQDLEELVRLLEEQRTLEGAAVSLEGAAHQPQQSAERGFIGIRDPLVRAERALRELRSVERQRELERDITRRHPASGKPRVRRKLVGDGAEQVDIVKEAAAFASAHEGTIPLHEFAEHVLTLAPDRYRNTATAQASLYYHLGKSERFTKAGPSMFRMLDGEPIPSREEAPADSSSAAGPPTKVESGDLPFE